MTAHMITDLPSDPTAPPVANGWDGLSAAMIDEVGVIADRDDLIVTIAPGAAYGHPAVFIPANAAIEIDGTHLGVDPA